MPSLGKPLLLCAALAAGAAHAQLSDSDAQARDAIRGSFISCAAAGVLGEDASIGQELLRRLALPPQATRDRVYAALCELTADKSPRVRKEGPQFVLEAGEQSLLMRYDTQRKQITSIELLPGVERPEPAAAAEEPKLPAPAPAAEAQEPEPRPAPEATVIRLPPPRVRTGACIIKPVMTDDELRACGAVPRQPSD